MNPIKGGTPANEKNNKTIEVLINPVVRKNLYSFSVLKILKSKIKNNEKKNVNNAL